MDRGYVLLALIAGTLFGLCVPFSKVLIGDMKPIMLAGFLYSGAAIGMATLFIARAKVAPPRSMDPMSRTDMAYMIGSTMIGGVAAPILLMVGLEWTAGSDASLLLNLEGVMTAIIAVALFHDRGGLRLWTALVAMTGASVILSYSPGGGFGGNGAVLIIMAMVCWGADNNLMKKISHHDPVKLSTIRNSIAAIVLTTLSMAIYGGLDLSSIIWYALIIGAIGYGLSNMLFFVGLRHLGPSRTGTFFSVGPYAAAMAAIPLLGEPITYQLVLAGVLMAAGTLLLTKERSGETV